MFGLKNRKCQYILVFLLVAMVLPLANCSPENRSAVQTLAAESARTAVVVLKTLAPPVETEAAKAAGTAIAEGRKAAETNIDALRDTAVSAVGTNVATRIQGISGTPVPKKAVIDYYALGDSIAAGYGLKPDEKYCYQSPYSYPNRVIALLHTRYEIVNPTILACNGASITTPGPRITDLDPKKAFITQVDAVERGLTSNPTLVSITIGANDLGWSDFDNFVGNLYLTDDDFYTWADAIISDTLREQLTAQIQRLLAHDNVAVVLTEVFNPANPRSVFLFKFSLNINSPCGIVPGACYDRLDYLVVRLNSMYMEIHHEINQPDRFSIAPIKDLFKGHEADAPCGLDTIAKTYIQRPWDAKSDGLENYLADNPNIKLPINNGGDCFHPNYEGAQVIAEAVNRQALLLDR